MLVRGNMSFFTGFQALSRPSTLLLAGRSAIKIAQIQDHRLQTVALHFLSLPVILANFVPICSFYANLPSPQIRVFQGGKIDSFSHQHTHFLVSFARTSSLLVITFLTARYLKNSLRAPWHYTVRKKMLP